MFLLLTLNILLCPGLHVNDFSNLHYCICQYLFGKWFHKSKRSIPQKWCCLNDFWMQSLKKLTIKESTRYYPKSHRKAYIIYKKFSFSLTLIFTFQLWGQTLFQLKLIFSVKPIKNLSIMQKIVPWGTLRGKQHSKLTYFIEMTSSFSRLATTGQQSLNLDSAQVQILLAAWRRFAMMRTSNNGPGWK